MILKQNSGTQAIISSHVLRTLHTYDLSWQCGLTITQHTRRVEETNCHAEKIKTPPKPEVLRSLQMIKSNTEHEIRLTNSLTDQEKEDDSRIFVVDLPQAEYHRPSVAPHLHDSIAKEANILATDHQAKIQQQPSVHHHSICHRNSSTPRE